MYAPFDVRFSFSFSSLKVGTLCLERAKTDGVEVDFRANSQLSFTSTPSAGLKLMYLVLLLALTGVQ